jgi:hypothetical protein
MPFVRGERFNDFVTTALRLQSVTTGWGQKSSKLRDVIYGRPHRKKYTSLFNSDVMHILRLLRLDLKSNAIDLHLLFFLNVVDLLLRVVSVASFKSLSFCIRQKEIFA